MLERLTEISGVVLAGVILLAACTKEPGATNEGMSTEASFVKKIEEVPTDSIRYSQVDLTEGLEDNLKLKPDDWIKTTPLNISTKDPEKSGLPPLDATPDKIHAIASKLSAIREQVHLSNDGVYCPVCHIANTQLAKLHTPCPKCQRKLLKFGWD